MRTNIQRLALNGILAGAYAALTLVAAGMNLAYGPVQFRFSEALVVLPFLFPGTCPGLFLGCLIANLLSPYGPLDLLFGTLATLLAALLTQRSRNAVLACLWPVLTNALFVGGVLTVYMAPAPGTLLPVFAANALWMALGEAVVVFLLGSLLLKKLPAIPSLKKYIPASRGGTLPDNGSP